jgi:tRNA G26 N,N-dimethylase Trm1
MRCRGDALPQLDPYGQPAGIVDLSIQSGQCSGAIGVTAREEFVLE